MKKQLLFVLIASQVGIAYAKDATGDNQKMSDKMFSACK